MADSAGGHSFRVEGVELTGLGQQGEVGRYPLHWHMAGVLVPGHSYVRNNSIHHTLQRCDTCHGTMGCQEPAAASQTP